MARTKLTEQEWETFLKVAERLGIPMRELPDKQGRFTELEWSGHCLGRAIAQAATERLAGERAEQMVQQQGCPTCGARCSVVHREREFATLDGPVELREPVAHCSACRRDFFPSACGVGTRSAAVQPGGDG